MAAMHARPDRLHGQSRVFFPLLLLTFATHSDGEGVRKARLTSHGAGQGFGDRSCEEQRTYSM